MRAVVVGAGLAGATANYELRRRGWTIDAFDESWDFGGLSRNGWLEGVLIEPHGSHIFHTEDDEVWNIVSSLTPFWRYEHSVVTMVRGRKMTWPIQIEEVREVYGAETATLMERMIDPQPVGMPDPSQMSFKDYCASIMTREVYEDFVAPYTEKQWGVSAKQLSAEFAPKRVQVRRNGERNLFYDRYQGFPDAREGGSYDQMHRGLWGRTLEDGRIHTNWKVDITGLRKIVGQTEAKLVVITVPLDELCGNELGPLEWRGLTFQHRVVRDREFAQDCMVVNWPSKDWPFIRTHETKHASRQETPLTVLTTEFPGGPGRYYPVPGRGGRLRELNDEYQEYIRSALGAEAQIVFCGRLAQFRYFDQDDAMRDALDAVRDALDGDN